MTFVLPTETGLFHFAVGTSMYFSEILNHSDPSTPCDLNPLFRKRLITPCPVSDVRYRPVPVAKRNKTLVVRYRWSIPSADRLGEDSDWQRPRQIGRKVNGVARFADNPPAPDFFVLGPVVRRNGSGVETELNTVRGDDTSEKKSFKRTAAGEKRRLYPTISNECRVLSAEC